MLKLSVSPEMMQDMFSLFGMTQKMFEEKLSELLHENVKLFICEFGLPFQQVRHKDFAIHVGFDGVFLTELRGKKVDKFLFKTKIKGE